MEEVAKVIESRSRHAQPAPQPNWGCQRGPSTQKSSAFFAESCDGPVFALVRVASDSETDDAEEKLMTLKIEQIPGKRRTRIRLSAHIEPGRLQ